MARPHIQFRLPESLYPHVLAFKAEHGLNDTGAMVRMIEAFFGVGNHAESTGHADEIAALKVDKYALKLERDALVTQLHHVEAELEVFRNKPERLPKTPKRKAEWKPLSEHTKARRRVFWYFDNAPHRGATSSEIASWVNGSTNNCAKRIQELAAEGYLEATGEYRKSRDSGKMLTVWKRTDKPLPEGL
ncbi:MAG: hypothetical protein A2Y38_00580 [Spirochaetes bacterium GWB1_59_5]|nr:MAG: hypothetical protein A2Y38_00580 [Spirochaetes bacterium GWB1_59_5]